jgi:peptidoglycan pentaglycine glycine transferase (the first glycine)
MNDVNLDSSPLVCIDDDAAWDEFVAAHNGHILQSFAWGELKRRFGWQAERWAWLQGQTVGAGAQVLIRRQAPGLQIAYVPRGPVTPDESFLEALDRIMRRRGVFLLKVEPNRLRDEPGDEMLTGAGFYKSDETIQPPATIHIDLTRDLATILDAMKSKWRYNIRLAEKKGVLVRPGTADDVPAFYELTRLTAERDRFAVHSLAYYRSAFELLTARDAARLFVAQFEGKSLAMIFVTAFAGEAIYLYGASGNDHRNVMPNHALHWTAMRWAKARGCTRYDFWGVPRDTAVGTHQVKDLTLPNSLYQFKQGFGGEVVRYTGAWDLVYSRPAYSLYRLVRALRRGSLG